jgi:hypothetical protein
MTTAVRAPAPPTLPHGVRLATVADVDRMRAFAQVLVFDRQLDTTRTARIRGFTGEAVRIEVVDRFQAGDVLVDLNSTVASLWLVDDELEELPRHAHVIDTARRFWLVTVNR